MVAAALSLVAEVGLDGATVAAIASRAHVRQGLVHYHFADKDELIRALAEQVFGVLMQRIDTAGRTEPSRRLLAVVLACLPADHAVATCAAMAALRARARADEHLGPVVAAFAHAREERLSLVVRECAGRGGDPPWITRVLALAIDGGCDAIASGVPQMVVEGTLAKLTETLCPPPVRAASPAASSDAWAAWR
jgi:AcrR family transcriptional regulator